MAGKFTDPGEHEDRTAEFFEDLSTRGTEPLLHDVAGTVRVDLDEGQQTSHYLVTIDRGALRVSARNVRADAVVHTDRSLFNQMAEGRVNANAAFLRGLLSLEGDFTLAMAFTRLFPGPEASQRSFLKREEARAR